MSVGQRLKSANFTKDFERNWLSISVPRADSWNSTEGPSTWEQGRLDVYSVEAILITFLWLWYNVLTKVTWGSRALFCLSLGLSTSVVGKSRQQELEAAGHSTSSNREQRVRNVPTQPAFSISWGTGSPLREWSCPQRRWGFPQELT